MRVLIVDDHEMFATSLARVLSDAPDATLCGTCTSLAELPATLATQRPNVVVADWNLADGTGAAVFAAVTKHRPEARVVVLTGEKDPDVARAALQAGCTGFVTKDRAAEDILAAVRAAARGDSHFTSAATDAVRGNGRSHSVAESLGLSEREVEVVELLAQSLTNRQIADALYLSPYTVRNHIHRIAAKLGVSNRLEVVVRAADAGLVSVGHGQ